VVLSLDGVVLRVAPVDDGVVIGERSFMLPLPAGDCIGVLDVPVVLLVAPDVEPGFVLEFGVPVVLVPLGVVAEFMPLGVVVVELGEPIVPVVPVVLVLGSDLPVLEPLAAGAIGVTGVVCA
jgi:hypothetical protein